MRAIWKGAVSFGLVSVPVRVYAATGTNDVRFHQVHAEDGGRIRYQRVCSVDGEEVTYADIAKGYETADGEQVVLTDEDLAQLPLRTNREIEVVEFVPADQVDPVLHAKTYYLEPERTALKPYTLLREALAETERVAVVKVALRARESLAILRVRDDVICLQTLLWPDEVREPAFDVLAGEVELRPQEQAMAASLVESLASDFDADAFSDGYAVALAEMVEQKVSSGDVVRPPTPEGDGGEGGGQVVDLLAALQRSVSRARQERGEPEPEPAPADEAAPEPATRKRATRKTAAAPTEEAGPARSATQDAPATKAPARKAPATKAPAKKASAKAPAKRAAEKEESAKKQPTKRAAAKKESSRRSA